MANRIRVSAVGADYLKEAPPGGMRRAVAAAVEYWRGRLAQVLPDRPDLILVPEMCDTFFSLSRGKRAAYHRARGNRVRDLFAQTARENSCYVVYPAARELPDGTMRNSMQVFDRKGALAGVYDKVHPVVEETTEEGFLPGRKAELIECDFGKVACAICFDLNFTDLLLEYARLRPDLVLFSSMFHGSLLEGLWAYTCRAHLVAALAGVSRPSSILSPQGEIIARNTNYTDFVTAEINLDCRLAHLDYNAKKLVALKQKYGRDVRVHDPGLLGSVLITSEAAGTSAEEMAREFKIELLDDYLNRALEFHRANGAWRPSEVRVRRGSGRLRAK